MMVVEGSVIERADACLIVGDGGREKRLFKIVAEAYNHSKTVLQPMLPTLEKIGRPGLDGIAKALAVLVSRQRVGDYVYLVLIDLEYVESVDDVEAKLREYGFEVLETEALGEGCYRLRVKRGAKYATVYMAVFGDSKCRSIEAHIVKVVRELYGEELECDKKSIQRWLKRRGIRDSELIQEAMQKRLISRIFPQLIAILQQLAKDS